MTTFLFTTLPTNDLGLLTRSLPIARELAEQGHTIWFCSPAKAPSRLIAEAGFDNLVPRHPIYDLMRGDQSLQGLVRFITSGQWRQRYDNLFRFFYQLIPALPIKSAPNTLEVWNMDHAGALMGLLNEGFVRVSCSALQAIMVDCGADVLVDFWNPLAVMAARAQNIPVITVIQADAHPASQGFIWWKTPPSHLPTPVPVMNKVLAENGLPPISTLSELCVGDLTLVVGMPETDPLPATADVTYVGPILWQKPGATLPDWIANLGREKPLIWVYSGNPRYSSKSETLDSMVVVRACISALANEDMHVVLTTGHHPLPKEVLPLPANFRHEPYVPGLAMAERSDLLIHHGAMALARPDSAWANLPSSSRPTQNARATRGGLQR